METTLEGISLSVVQENNIREKRTRREYFFFMIKIYRANLNKLKIFVVRYVLYHCKETFIIVMLLKHFFNIKNI